MSTEGRTYGVEHEWADWDVRTPLPEGFSRDTRDYTIVNSNGIANDPTLRYYPYGGEICTPPTDTIHGQVLAMHQLQELLPTATVNYRSNLHVHVRIPGLRDNLYALKSIQRYIHEHMPAILEVIQPLPRPGPAQAAQRSGADRLYSEDEWLEGARLRWRRMLVSHQTLLTPRRLAHQLEAQSVTEFLEREVPWSEKKGRPQWQCQPRLCVNLRQLLETDTVEFRHFAGTMDSLEVCTALHFADRFLTAARAAAPIEELLAWCRTQQWPRFQPYQHWMETRYRATAHNGKVDKQAIATNINLILENKW